VQILRPEFLAGGYDEKLLRPLETSLLDGGGGAG